MYRSVMVSAILVMCSLSFGQELLVNPSFDSPGLAGCTPYDQPFPPYNADPASPDYSLWQVYEGSWNRNGSVWVPPCPRDGDGARASWSITGPGKARMGQVVSNLTPGQSLRLEGWWVAGHQASGGQTTVTAELRDGVDPSDPANLPLIASKTFTQGGSGCEYWQQFCVSGAPSGTSVTVVFVAEATGAPWDGMNSVHVDGCTLTVGEANPPKIDTVSPTYAARGANVSMSMTGLNFVPGGTVVKVVQGDRVITATNVDVASDGKSLTCNLSLLHPDPPYQSESVANGRWNVVVDTGVLGCAPDVLPGGFRVVLSTLGNGSFQQPVVTSPPGGDCATEYRWPDPLARPTDWMLIETNAYGYGNALLRNSQNAKPTCPTPDTSKLYASTESTNSGGECKIFQTILVDPTNVYTFSGFFAGAGDNTVTFELLDGDENGPAITGASLVVNPCGAQYDWGSAPGRRLYISGQPSGDLLTVQWRVTANGAGPHVAHADGLKMEACDMTRVITVTSIDPPSGTAGKTVSMSVFGTGFVGTPTVQLIDSCNSTIITGSSVTRVSDTQLTCNFNLAGAKAGAYDVFVKQGTPTGCTECGCIANLPDGFTISCPQTVSGMTPSSGISGTTVNATVDGAGFVGTPGVKLVRGAHSIDASNVVVANEGRITCDFDLTGATSGRYDLVVAEAGCDVTAARAFLVIGEAFVNGSFELPDVGAVNCGTPVNGTPTGWDTTGPSGLNRDGMAPAPPVCPSPTDGGHYGSMSYGDYGVLRAWQTVAVIKGSRYEFSGDFTAPEDVVITLRLIDGEEDIGTELASTEVTGSATTWVHGSVAANAVSPVMSVVWEMVVPGVPPNVGGHADGLKFESSCGLPRADADLDGDVDQTDFAVIQSCFTGPTWPGPLGALCSCFDYNGNQAIEQSDVTAFENCASGPGIPWSATPECQN